jgi:hypothetical protein
MALITQKDVDERDLVARYLADRLSDAERTSFEAYYVDRPEVLAELNRTAKLKSGLMDLQQSGELATLIERRRWQHSRLWGLAASFVVVMGAALWLTLQSSPRPLAAASLNGLGHRFQTMLPLEASYHLERTRASSYDASIQLPSNAGAIELRVKPEVVYPHYRMTLQPVGSEGTLGKRVTLAGLSPGSDGLISLYLNGSELSPAVYELKIASDVAPSSGGEPESAFLIEITRAD